MDRALRMALMSAVVAAGAVFGPAAKPACAQVSFRGAGYFGGGSYWGGGYAFERFSVWSWRNPYTSNAYGYIYGYGGPYGAFSPNVEAPPFTSYGLYPMFTYVTSDENASRPRVLDLSTPTTSNNPQAARAATPPPATAAAPATQPPAPATERKRAEGPTTVVYRASRY